MGKQEQALNYECWEQILLREKFDSHHVIVIYIT